MWDFIVQTVPYFKAIHIAGLAVWAAGLFALPFMLAKHQPDLSTQAEYARMRTATHLAYIYAVTPAAVITVIAGTWLIFLREVFHPWFYAKLAFVACLMTAHIWIGHIIVSVAETPGENAPPNPVWPLAAALVPAAAILFLVLAKPDLSGLDMPSWLTEPRGGQLPFEVPKR